MAVFELPQPRYPARAINLTPNDHNPSSCSYKNTFYCELGDRYAKKFICHLRLDRLTGNSPTGMRGAGSLLTDFYQSECTGNMDCLAVLGKDLETHPLSDSYEQEDSDEN